MHLIGQLILSLLIIAAVTLRYKSWIITVLVIIFCVSNILFFTAFVQVAQGSIRIITLNPFKKGLKINFADVDKIFLRRPTFSRIFAFSHIIITTRGNSFKYFLGLQNDMDLLYQYISEQTKNVDYDAS